MIRIIRNCSICGDEVGGRSDRQGRVVCFTCKQKRKKEWREKNKEKIKQYRKLNRLKLQELRKKNLRKI